VPPSVVDASPAGEGTTSSIDRRLFGQLATARRALITSVAIGVVTTVTVIAQMLLLARLLDWAMSSHPGPFPTATVVGLLAALTARSVAGGLGESVASRAGVAVTSELRRTLLDAVVARGPIGAAHERTGALTLSATRGLRSLEPYFSRYLPAAVVAALAPPLALVVLAVLDWPSVAIALLLVAVVPFAMIRLGRHAASESERQWRRLSSMSGRFLELLRGIPTLRSLGRVDRGRQEVIAANEAVSQSVSATLRAAMASSAVLEFLAGVGVGLVAMLAGLRLLHGSMTVGTALAVILITPEVFLPLRRAGAEFHASTEGRSAAVSVFAAIDASMPSGGRATTRATNPAPLHAQDLSVSYADGAPVISDLTFVVEPGEHLVVQGPSGCGKSTLLAVLSGFVQPAGGTIELGGVDGAALDWTDARRMISLVPQVPHVFADSLRANLTLGATVDDARLVETLELVGLADLAADVHGGLDRRLDEAGRSLSAGERQRLGLARVILQDRALVLLDEPTAHLDQATIHELRHRLGPWLAARSVVEVTHRPGLLGLDATHLTLPTGGSPS